MRLHRTILVALRATLLLAISGLLSAAEPAVVPADPTPGGMPPLPPFSSPVKFFRDLLAKPAAERGPLLANRPAESRQVILAKLQEYEALPAGERELRLRTTELSWYLKQLLPLAAAQRQLFLTNLAASDRELVKARLVYWDRIPPEQQQRLLENQAAVPYLAGIRAGVSVTPLPADRQKLMEDLERLRRLRPGEREKVLEQFKQLFELSDQERSKLLDERPGPERAQLQRALNQLQKIPADKQAAYVEAVGKFAVMSREEQAQFLKSAESWKQLSAEQQAAWRALFAQSLPELPPLPPGFDLRSPPPMPPDTTPPRPPRQATNDAVRPNTGA